MKVRVSVIYEAMMTRDVFFVSRFRSGLRLLRSTVATLIVVALTSSIAVAQVSSHQKIAQTVCVLGYSDNSAALLVKTVDGWNDRSGRSYFDAFVQNLKTVEEGSRQGWSSRERLVETQVETVRALGECIQQTFTYKEDYFDLPDVLKAKRANCFGYAQLLYILGNATGLSVHVVSVSEPEAFSPAHIANIVDLADDTVVFVDLTRGADCVSEPFALRAEPHIVWTQNRNGTPISVDSKRLSVLDGNDLVAEIHFSRGTVANLAGRYAEAIDHYSKSIERSPRCARAYNNRGAVHLFRQEYENALADFDKAIHFDAQYVQAWQNRGSAYLGLGRYDKAIAEYTEAIRLAPRLSNPLFCRGYAHIQQARYVEGIDDYTRAIALDPTSARLFYRRGIAYARVGDREKARSDLVRAVELDRSVVASVTEVSRQFNL